MKKMTKKLVLMLAAVMVMSLCLVGCGGIQKDVEGDWTTDSINGKPVAEYAAEIGTNVAGAASNMNIKGDKLTMTNSALSQTFDLTYSGNDIQVKSNGALVLTLTYDPNAKTISYKINVTGEEDTYTLKKGTTDLSNPLMPGDDAETGAEDGSEAAAE